MLNLNKKCGEIMKLKTAIILSITFLIVPFFLYFLNFHNFSNNNQDWANFGSYIGGVVSSVFSYLSFFIVLIVFYTTKKENDNKEIEERIFKYLELINNCQNKIITNIDPNKILRGESVFSQFNGMSFRLNELIENNKSKQLTDPIRQLLLTLVFYKNPISEYYELIIIYLNYVEKKGFKKKNEYIPLLSSQMSEQQKMAFAIIYYLEIDKYDSFNNVAYKGSPIDAYRKIGENIEEYYKLYKNENKIL